MELNLKQIIIKVVCTFLIILAACVTTHMVMNSYKKEKLTNVSGTDSKQNLEIQEKSHATEKKYEDIPIKPAIYDPGTGTVTDGPDLKPSQFMSPWYQAYTGNVKNYYLLDDGEGGSAGLQFNMCSKACCGEQYPTPFKMEVDKAVCMNKDEFVPTNYMCNNAWQDTGCVCMTKKQAGHLADRGGNA